MPYVLGELRLRVGMSLGGSFYSPDVVFRCIEDCLKFLISSHGYVERGVYSPIVSLFLAVVPSLLVACIRGWIGYTPGLLLMRGSTIETYVFESLGRLSACWRSFVSYSGRDANCGHRISPLSVERADTMFPGVHGEAWTGSGCVLPTNDSTVGHTSNRQVVEICPLLAVETTFHEVHEVCQE